MGRVCFYVYSLIYIFKNVIIAELRRAKRASGAPWVRKFGNLSMREILVMTSAYAHPRVQTLGEGEWSPKAARPGVGEENRL